MKLDVSVPLVRPVAVPWRTQGRPPRGDAATPGDGPQPALPREIALLSLAQRLAAAAEAPPHGDSVAHLLDIALTLCPSAVSSAANDVSSRVRPLGELGSAVVRARDEYFQALSRRARMVRDLYQARVLSTDPPDGEVWHSVTRGRAQQTLSVYAQAAWALNPRRFARCLSRDLRNWANTGPDPGRYPC